MRDVKTTISWKFYKQCIIVTGSMYCKFRSCPIVSDKPNARVTLCGDVKVLTCKANNIIKQINIVSCNYSVLTSLGTVSKINHDFAAEDIVLPSFVEILIG